MTHSERITEMMHALASSNGDEDFTNTQLVLATLEVALAIHELADSPTKQNQYLNYKTCDKCLQIWSEYPATTNTVCGHCRDQGFSQ